jgi:hypothetical protein
MSTAVELPVEQQKSKHVITKSIIVQLQSYQCLYMFQIGSGVITVECIFYCRIHLKEISPGCYDAVTVAEPLHVADAALWKR